MAAYDVGTLVKKFESQGLNLAEEAAKGAVLATLEWFEESAKASATPFDDVALVVLPRLKEEALKLVDKIDGEAG